ncbi:hypothetical protein GF402_06440 [Candidatus Fermentibacteria bacterium]|nr:hypothetical protein [Candidatus Fermentibacteria bacterium]
MRYSFCFILAAAVALSAGNLMLDEPVLANPTGLRLQYDDGTSWWLTWDGTYRGVWFNTEDFFGYPTSYHLGEGEFWFYHYGYPYVWDASAFYCEIYSGDQSGPVTELDHTSATATHNSPVYAVHWPTIITDPNFWIIENTEMSSGGWPSTLGDNTPNSVDHSFYSDDFQTWEPWVIQGPGANDLFIRAIWRISLKERTWGSIKTLF